MKKITLKSILAISLIVASSCSRADLKPEDSTKVQNLINQFNAIYDDRNAWDKINNSTDMYQRFPAIDALVDMYELSARIPSGMNPEPSLNYIYRALYMAELYMFRSHSRIEGGFKVWSTGQEEHPENLAHYEIRAAAGISKLLLLTSPHNTKYSFPASVTTRSRALAEEVYNHIWQKWKVVSAQGYDNHIWNNPAADVISRAGIIALALENWSLGDAEPYYYLTYRAPYAITSESYTKNGKSVLNIYCKSSKARCTGGFPSTPSGVTDTGHAVDSVSYAIAATYDNPLPYGHGAISSSKMTALYHTLKEVIWNGSSSNPMFHDYVDGYGNQITAQGSQQGGWAKLARFDHSLRDVYYEYIEDGGVNCFGDNALRFGNATKFGTGNPATQTCNENTQYVQAHLIASLLNAYINRED